MGEQDKAVHRTSSFTGAGQLAYFRRQARTQLTLRGGGICASKGVESALDLTAAPADLTAARSAAAARMDAWLADEGSAASDAEKRAREQMVEAEEIAARVKFDELKEFGGGCAACA